MVSEITSIKLHQDITRRDSYTYVFNSADWNEFKIFIQTMVKKHEFDRMYDLYQNIYSIIQHMSLNDIAMIMRSGEDILFKSTSDESVPNISLIDLIKEYIRRHYDKDIYWTSGETLKINEDWDFLNAD